LHSELRGINFDVSLTVHLSVTLANEQLDAQILNTFIIILYGHLLIVTIPDAVLIQFDLLRMSKILLETCTCRES